jgi:hypothetical protein
MPTSASTGQVLGLVLVAMAASDLAIRINCLFLPSNW